MYGGTVREFTKDILYYKYKFEVSDVKCDLSVLNTKERFYYTLLLIKYIEVFFYMYI